MGKALTIIIVLLVMILGISLYGNFAAKQPAGQYIESPKKIAEVKNPAPPAVTTPPAPTTDLKPIQSSKADPFLSSDGKILSLKPSAGNAPVLSGFTEEQKNRALMLFFDVLASPSVHERVVQIAVDLERKGVNEDTALNQAFTNAEVQILIVEKLRPVLSQPPYNWDNKTMLAFSMVLSEEVASNDPPSVKNKRRATPDSTLKKKVDDSIAAVKSAVPELTEKLSEHDFFTAMSEVLGAFKSPDAMQEIDNKVKSAKNKNPRMSPTEAKATLSEIMDDNNLIVKIIVPQVRSKLSQAPYNWSEADIVKFTHACGKYVTKTILDHMD